MKSDPEKTAHNARSAQQMHTFLQAKTWEEKVRSMERMRAATREARKAMARTLEAESASKTRE